MTGQCKGCVHWELAVEYETGHQFGFGRCKNVPMFWDATEWDDERDGRQLIEKYKDRKAFAQDGSDYMARLITAPDFGCIAYLPIES